MKTAGETPGARASLGSVGAALLATSCAFVPAPVSEPGLEVEWRERRLFEGPHAFVWASSRPAAAKVHASVEDVAGELVGQGTPPGKGVVIAVDHDDAPLLPDARELWEALQRWHVAATRGAGAPGPAPVELGADALGAEVLTRAVTAGFPRDARALDLPPGPTKGIQWVAIVPTDDALAAVSYALVDAGLARSLSRWSRYCACKTEDFSFDWRRLTRELKGHRRARLREVMLPPGGAAAHRALGPEGEPLEARLARLASARVSGYWPWRVARR